MISSLRIQASLSYFSVVIYTHSTLGIVHVHIANNFLTDLLTHEEQMMGGIEKAGDRKSLVDGS